MLPKQTMKYISLPVRVELGDMKKVASNADGERTGEVVEEEEKRIFYKITGPQLERSVV